MFHFMIKHFGIALISIVLFSVNLGHAHSSQIKDLLRQGPDASGLSIGFDENHHSLLHQKTSSSHLTANVPDGFYENSIAPIAYDLIESTQSSIDLEQIAGAFSESLDRSEARSNR